MNDGTTTAASTGRSAISGGAQPVACGRLLLPENLQSSLQGRHLPALDGLRAVAVFLVMLYHFGFAHVPGGMGVHMFFVLSGFLITWLLLKEQEGTGTVSLRNFFVRRSLRIFPAFYAFWALYIGAFGIARKKIIWTQALCSLFYVNNYFQAIHGEPNTGLGHTWSLGVEEQFYLIWAPLFLLLCCSRARVRKALVGLIIALWIYREVLVLGLGVFQGYVYEAFDTRADNLFVGCLLAVALRTGYAARVWRFLCCHAALSIVTVALLFGSISLQWHFGTFYRDAVGFVVEPVFVAVLIAQTIAFHKAFLWRWLQFRWIRYLGRISYSLYLYQNPIMEPVRRHLPGHSTGFQLGAALCVVIAMASASYFIVEKPFLRLKDRFHRRPTTETRPAPAARRAEVGLAFD